MTGHERSWSRERLASYLLILFAFAAWNLTGLANVALALLCLLFALDLPRHWGRLRRDPGLWLLLGGIALTATLAVRAALLLPETAGEQWSAISAWVRPLLFVVSAWWLRGDPTLARRVLAAALLGLVIGLLRKTEWSDLLEAASGQRADFGYSALGLGFLASIALLGLFSFQREIRDPRLLAPLPPRIGRILGWILWGALVGVWLTVLFVTQARGATLALALAVGASVLYRGLSGSGDGRRLGAVLTVGVLSLALTVAVLWASRDRIVGDLASLAQAPAIGQQSYESSLGTRINLYRIGLSLFAEQPLLGWGPGTSGTEHLIPSGALPLSDYDRVNAPSWSHLHSVAIEVLVRFGLVGLVLGLSFVILLAQAYRALWRGADDAPLRGFLLLGGIMAWLDALYDFRLLSLDLSFFFILFFGILYGFRMALPGSPTRPDG